MIDTSRSMIYHIGNLNNESQKISKQMASGKAIDKGSDDALLHADLINIEDRMRVTESLKLQITKSQALNETADQTLSEIKNSLDKIKLDIMKSLNDGMDRSDKLALSSNLKGIRENLIDNVNTKIDGEYIFTGSVTTKQPIVKDDEFKINGQVNFEGDAFLRKIAVQPGSYRDRGVTAHDVIFYNSDTSADDGAVTFKSREIIIDENGFTWEPDFNDISERKLVKLDYNGVPTDEYMRINNITYDPQEIVFKNTAVENDTFEVRIQSAAGDDDTLTYTLGVGETIDDAVSNLTTQINALGYMSANVGTNDNIEWSSTEEIQFTLSTTSNDAIIALPEAKMTTETIAEARNGGRIGDVTKSGLLLEVKHNYLDDLNVIINTLEGYETLALENSNYTGRKSDIITDAKVDIIMKDMLEITTGQFNATNIGHGELGGRNKVFDISYEKLSVQSTHYNILYQEYGGADMAKLAMESKSLELTYQALYSTIAKMNQLSLVNFVK